LRQRKEGRDTARYVCEWFGGAAKSLDCSRPNDAAGYSRYKTEVGQMADGAAGTSNGEIGA
jgi:hypothetical protein